MINQNIIIKTAGLAAALSSGLLLAVSPAAAEMEEGGDFGAATPEGPSIEAYGDNTGEISLPEENTTPAFESESSGDFGATEPSGLSIEAYGDNTGEVNIPNREGTRDADETDNQSEFSSDYGASEPDSVDIDNYGENNSVY